MPIPGKKAVAESPEDSKPRGSEERVHIDENLDGQKFLEAVREFFGTIGVEPGSEQESLLLGQFLEGHDFKEKPGQYGDYHSFFRGNPVELLTGEDDTLIDKVNISHTQDSFLEQEIRMVKYSHAKGGFPMPTMEEERKYRRDTYGAEELGVLRNKLKENLSKAINSGNISVLTPWRGGNAVMYDGLVDKAIVFDDNCFSVSSRRGVPPPYLKVLEKTKNKIVVQTNEYHTGMTDANYLQYVCTITLDVNGKTMIDKKRVPQEEVWGDTGP